MMDKYKLLSFYLGNLEGDNAASNDKTPGATSRKNRDLSGGCHTNKKQKQHDTSQQPNPKRYLVSNIAGLCRSVDVVAASSIEGQIERYKKEEGDLLSEATEVFNT